MFKISDIKNLRNLQNEKLIESVSTATPIKRYGFNKSLFRVWSATVLI
jgi:hypothetical protein